MGLAKAHWKANGHREGRFATIEAFNGSPHKINNNYGFAISDDLYDRVIEIIDKQSPRDTKNFLTELQEGQIETRKIWVSRPDLIIPRFSNPANTGKNQRTALQHGWYYNFYK